MKHAASRRRPVFDVITIGSGVIDHFAKSKAFELEPSRSSPTGFDACFPLGAKLALDDLSLHTGGGATNAAATFGRLKFKTAAVCRVGNDVFGGLVTDQLRSDGVSTAFVQVDPKVGTGQSIILLAHSGHRSILSFRGASAEINTKAIPWNNLTARWFYITSLGGDIGLLSLILDRALACGAKVAWNPGGAELSKGLDKLTPLIRRVDIFDVNREEAASLTETPVRHLKTIMDMIADLPRVALLLSDGPRGAYLSARGCTWFSPALPGRRVNTTGAGDALGSGFVAGFVKTCDLTIGLRVGMLNALGVIMQMGAKNGILESWPSERELARVRIQSAHIRN